MKKWMPEWLARNYFRLQSENPPIWNLNKELEANLRWYVRVSRPFSFSDAQKVLEANLAIVQKTLWELEIRGFLIKRPDELKSSARAYQLALPEDLNEVFNAYFKFPAGSFEKMSIEKKLAKAPWKYAVTGTTAAYYYHHYQAPGKLFEIIAWPGDFTKFMAFLSDHHTVVFPDSPIETRRAKHYVKISKSYAGAEGDFIESQEGLSILKVEPLIVEFLAIGTRDSLIQVIALLVSQSKNIDWQNLIEHSKRSELDRQLACLIEIINSEARRPLTDSLLLKEFLNNPPYGGKIEALPKAEKETMLGLNREASVKGPWMSPEENEQLKKQRESLLSFQNQGKKWLIEVLLPKSNVRKVLDDLGIELRA